MVNLVREVERTVIINMYESNFRGYGAVFIAF